MTRTQARARMRMAWGWPHPRSLARAWVRVIYRCWADRVPYDATKHTAAVRFAEQQAQAELAAQTRAA